MDKNNSFGIFRKIFFGAQYRVTGSFLGTKSALLRIGALQKQPPEVFCKKGVLRNFSKFPGKDLCQSLFFNKVVGLRPPTLLKKRLYHNCFPVHFEKFLRTPFLTEHLRWLLLALLFFLH